MSRKIKNLLRKTSQIIRRTALASLAIIILLPAAESYAISQNDYDNINTPFYDECTIDGVANSLANMPNGDLAKGPFLPDSQIPGKNTEEKIWNYLIGLGFEPEIAAGILGNINNEGSFPTNIEDPAGETKNWDVLLGLTEQNQGFGLIGFTPGRSLAKGDTVGADWSGTAKVDVNKNNFYYISTQLAVVYGYMKNYNGIYDKLVKAKDEKDAAYIFLDEVENPADPSGETPERQAEATEMLKKYRNNKIVFGQAQNIYVLGDSISVRARATMKAEFQKRGAKSVTINASASRSITADGVSPKTSGLEAATNDKKKISKADKIVIQLGTNQRDANFQQSVGDLYQKIHSYNKTADIYWVGVFSKGGSDGYDRIDRGAINTLIKSQAGSLGFKYIDTEKANIPLDDSVHQTHPAGSKKLVETIAESVFDKSDITSGGATASKTNGNCVCPVNNDDPAGTPGASLHGGTNAEKIFNYLIDNAGLSAKQAAAAVGSMMLESGGNTENLDPTATNPSSGAYGIAQWLDSRMTALQTYADKKGGEVSDLDIQAGHLVDEMKHNINAYDHAEFKKKKTLEAASEYWTNWFEGLAYSPDQQLHDDRIDNGNLILRKYGDYGGGGSVDGAEAKPGNCACTTDEAAANGKTVVIDPGHGPNKTTTDAATGLTMVESDNGQETKDVWDVSQKIKTDLSKEGYNVILTKKSIDENVTFRERAKIADDNKAALALSVHGDPGLSDPGQIFVQKVGLYRGSGSNKTTFNNAEVAKKSQEYAQIFKEEREKAEGGSVVIKDNSFDGRPGLEPGNIPMVQLFSKTPWVYNERKMSFNKDKYAEGLENSIKKILSGGSVGSPSGLSGGCPAGLDPGDLASAVKTYAWPEYSSRTDPKTEYRKALDKAEDSGQYIGGGYTDCGAFVTRVMIDSGYETNYNFSGELSQGAGPTYGGQIDWLKANWQKVGVASTKDLEPGDVAISDSHTYLYMGKDGFEGYDSASASLRPARTAMASNSYDLSSFSWYRKK